MEVQTAIRRVLWPMTEEDYRHFALAIRANAELISDAYEKRALLLIAQRYDILAEHAARRATGTIDNVEKSA